MAAFIISFDISPEKTPSMNKGRETHDTGQAKKGINSSVPIQPKLTVGTPNNIYEKEADAMADKVMRMPENNFIQRKYDLC